MYGNIYRDSCGPERTRRGGNYPESSRGGGRVTKIVVLDKKRGNLHRNSG